MKSLVLIAFAAVFTISCGKSGSNDKSTPSLPKNESELKNRLLTSCGQAPSSLAAAGFENQSSLDDFLTKVNARQITKNNGKHLVQFGFELKKIPLEILTTLANKGVEIRLMSGRGVTVDPSFPETTTFDGRSWADVPGSGGNPTRIVTNKLYRDHGSINLVVHEHGHTIDYNLSGYAISSSSEWLNLLKRDKNLNKILDESCGSYCTQNPNEALAETLAFYYHCGKTRALLNKSPEVISFLERLESFRL